MQRACCVGPQRIQVQGNVSATDDRDACISAGPVCCRICSSGSPHFLPKPLYSSGLLAAAALAFLPGALPLLQGRAAGVHRRSSLAGW